MKEEEEEGDRKRRSKCSASSQSGSVNQTQGLSWSKIRPSPNEKRETGKTDAAGVKYFLSVEPEFQNISATRFSKSDFILTFNLVAVLLLYLFIYLI